MYIVFSNGFPFRTRSHKHCIENLNITLPQPKPPGANSTSCIYKWYHHFNHCTVVIWVSCSWAPSVEATRDRMVLYDHLTITHKHLACIQGPLHTNGVINATFKPGEQNRLILWSIMMLHIVCYKAKYVHVLHMSL